MIVTKHAKKLAKISKTSYDALSKHRSQINEYLERVSVQWQIELEDTLDTYIQIFVYHSYKLYLHSTNLKQFELFEKKRRFPTHFAQNLFNNESTPSVLFELLINPVLEELLSWGIPEKTNIDGFFQFYGEYLRYYNPETAKDAGVVLTPKIIVKYIIQGINCITSHLLGVESGLKNMDFPFKIIDPSSGTMNFISELLKFVETTDNDSDRLNNKIFAMESNPLLYLLGLSEVSDLLDFFSTCHNFLLRNTLTEESYTLLEGFVGDKPDNSILILMGNPPYYINTQNNHPWIQNEINEYKKMLIGKNLKILSDDYVKFFRVSQKLFQSKNRRGIVAFITNNNYLDGSVFKSMRKSLLNTFNEIFVVNLHGNLRKGETGNPFNIKVGVSIIFLVKTDPEYYPDPDHTLSYLDYESIQQIHYLGVGYPTLDSKYKKLSQGFNINEFEKIEMTPDYFLIPRNYGIERKYRDFVPIDKLFLTEPRSGIMTGRDSLVSNPDISILQENMSLFFHKKFDQLRKLNVTVRKTKTWDPDVALSRTTEKNARNSIIRYYYRGLVRDYVVYDNFLVDGCRMGYLDTISSTNPAICVTRSIRTTHYSHALVVDSPPEKCLLGIKDSCYVFPLQQPQDLQQYNINLAELDYDLDPITLFYYIYAILYCPTYRSRYVEQLKRHFPRIPFPKNNENLIKEISRLGKQLVDIHLGQDKTSIMEFEIDSPTNLVIKNFYFDANSGKIFFSSQDNALSISNITQNMWDFDIGGIKQLRYWLRSRKFMQPSENKKKRHIGLLRPITTDELNEFLQICAKIKNTIKILPKLDKIFLQIDVL